MSDSKLIEVVKADDLSALKELLASGVAVNEQDEHGLEDGLELHGRSPVNASSPAQAA